VSNREGSNQAAPQANCDDDQGEIGCLIEDVVGSMTTLNTEKQATMQQSWTALSLSNTRIDV
jgi:hypothetical protein